MERYRNLITVMLTAMALIAGCTSGDEESTAQTTVATTAPPTTVAAPATVGATATTEATTAAVSPVVFEAADSPTDGWPVSTPEEQGMDSGRLAIVERLVEEGEIDSVTVVRNGYVVLDTVIYPFPKDTGHSIFSVTKSITGTLIGIAIDQGLLAGVDVPVVEILADAAPEDVDELKASMTVEDLLTMSAGMDCSGGPAQHVEMVESDDWTANVLAWPMVAEPGTQFEYCNGVSQLLSAILTEVTGTSAAEFAGEVLFEPLGITDYVWPASPDGISTGYSQLELQPADMAKIGYLYLRDGEWDGDQVVSPAWIEAATTTHIGPTTFADGYGYQWRVMDDGWAFAKGIGGQYIFVVPDQDLVVAFTSTTWGAREILEGVFRAVVSDVPLPPDPDAQLRLAEAVAAAGSGPPPTAVELPEMAATVDGARYEFRPNDFGNSWFTISFGDDSATLQLGVAGPPTLRPEPHLWFEDVGEPVEFEVGLDGRFIIDEAWGQPMAARGAWLDDDTFRIEYQIIGEILEGTYSFTFTDDVADVAFEDLGTIGFQKTEADRVT